MEISTRRTLWPVGHTTIQGQRTIIAALHMHLLLYVAVCICAAGWGVLKCQLGSVKIVQSGGLQLQGTLGTHNCGSCSNSQQISLSFAMTDETEDDD